MDVLGDICKNFLNGFEHCMNKDESYNCAKNRSLQFYRSLRDQLSENEQSTLDKIVSCYKEQIEKKTINSFKIGFKSGLAVAFQLLEID